MKEPRVCILLDLLDGALGVLDSRHEGTAFHVSPLYNPSLSLLLLGRQFLTLCWCLSEKTVYARIALGQNKNPSRRWCLPM